MFTSERTYFYARMFCLILTSIRSCEVKNIQGMRVAVGMPKNIRTPLTAFLWTQADNNRLQGNNLFETQILLHLRNQPNWKRKFKIPRDKSMLHIPSLTYFRNTVSKIMKVIVNTFLISLEMQQTSLVHQSALQPKVHEPRGGFDFFLIVQPVSCHHLLRSHQKEINVSGIGQTSTAHKPNELWCVFF